MEPPEEQNTLIFLGVPGDDAEVELTHNWDEAGYDGGRNFGHLAFAGRRHLRDRRRLADNGVTINRPSRDGHTAFVKSPDGASPIELLQKGGSLPAAEPWASMPNSGSW